MDLSDRITWFVIGSFVGLVVGYVVRLLQEIKEDLDGMDECVKHCRENHEHMRKPVRGRRPKNEAGAAIPAVVGQIALALVVALTVWAAFASQKASNDVQDTQARIGRITTCNQVYLTKTVEALNERTQSSQDRADANVELQKAQAAYLSIFLRPKPADVQESTAALKKYFDALTEFLKTSGQATADVKENPYPTAQELMSCINGEGAQGE
jgi:hypothetical protein